MARGTQVRYDRVLMVTRAVRSGEGPRRCIRARACGSRWLPAFVALLVVTPAVAAPTLGANKPAAKAGTAGKASGPSSGTPVGEESLSQRRAVRGVPVDQGSESPELSELRSFEEQAFPRAGLGAGRIADADAAGEAPPTLPGRWEGTGDVPEPLRSPETTLTPSRAPPAPDSDWLRSLNLPEIPVRWDPQVLRYLDYFKNNARGRSVMGNWLKRGGRFRLLIESVLEREGLPKDLFYVAMVESGFEPGARSPVGAGGVWQFMPGAARAYGLEVGYWVDARRDPERSVEAAARYLKDLYVRFGSWHLVFAAYNAGYGAVLKSIGRYNTNDFWELCHHEAGLPWESSLYVPKILAAAIVGRNLEAFGFGSIVPDPPFIFDKVQVPAGTGLATVARATKARPEVIVALNPQLVRDRTPPDRGKYELRIPAGTSALFAEAFDRSRGAGDGLETVTLRFGETLDAVAKTRGTTVRELRRLNGVKDSSELRAGIAIVVPPRSAKAGGKNAAALSPTNADGTVATGSSAGTTPAVTIAATDGAGTGGALLDEDDILVAVPDRVFNYEGRDRVFYRTRDGDTLDEIAEALGVRPDDLIEWNSLDATARLHPKMVLQIFVRKDFDPTQIVLLDPARVRVVTLGSREFLDLEAARRGKKRLVIEAKAGDTLPRIGRRYGLTIGDLARINRFSHNTELESGQKVVVYSPVGDGPREISQGLSPEPRRTRTAVALIRGGTPKGTDKVGAGLVDKTGDRTSDKTGDKTGDRTADRTVDKTGDKTGARHAPKIAEKPGIKSTAKSGERLVAKSGAKVPGAKVAPAKPAPKKK